MTVIWTPAAQGQLRGLNSDDPPPQAIARDPPLSARQRKQVYMHSALFSEGGTPVPHSKYVASRQVEIYDKIHAMKQLQAPIKDSSLPSPADMRATANSGQCVAASIQPTNGGSMDPVPASSIQFGDGNEPFRVVSSKKASEHLPKEVWGTSTRLGWSDQRSEILRPQGPAQKSWSGTDAKGRKNQDLASGVIAGTRMTEQSTQEPNQEIRSAPMHNVHCVDTSLDPQVDKKKSRSMTPRDRFIRNLACSDKCQFNDQETRGGSVPPPLKWRSGGGSDTQRGPAGAPETAEQRRRFERNFSDLTGEPRGSARRVGLSSNSHVHHAAGNNFLNPNNEVESRKGGGMAPLSPRNREEMNRSKLLGEYDPAQTPRVSARAPEVKEVQDAERPTFDTKQLMDLEGEISRRQRLERGMNAQDRDRSASQRRRDFFAGGAGRMGTGATPRPSQWDENPKPQQPEVDKRQIIRSASNSPASGRRYGGFATPDSARGRKMASMQSNIL